LEHAGDSGTGSFSTYGGLTPSQRAAGAHRFRHTLASGLLGIGASEREAADVLGISPAIVRKHYAKWLQQRQQRIAGLMQTLQKPGTFAAREEKPSVIQ
jgi:integrase